MDQLPLLITIFLYLQRQGLLSLLITVHMSIHGRKVLINPTKDVGYLLLSIMEGLFQGVTLEELVRGTLSRVTFQVPSFPTLGYEATNEL